MFLVNFTLNYIVRVNRFTGSRVGNSNPVNPTIPNSNNPNSNNPTNPTYPNLANPTNLNPVNPTTLTLVQMSVYIVP